MKFEKAKWVKYSNKILPRYAKKIWTIQIEKDKHIGFHNFENAIIFEKLIELEKKFVKGKQGEGEKE